MKQRTPKKVTIADIDFFITPFAAFYAANLSGEIMSVLAPILSGLAGLLTSNMNGEEFSLTDIKVEDAAGKLAPALAELDGDKLETLLRKLLINKGNISYSYSEDGIEYSGKLTYDEVNELFCQDVMGLYRLAWEVISLNFGNFLSKVPARSGNLGAVTVLRK